LHEPPWTITLPLVLLAIPSLVIGWPTIGPVLFGDYFGTAIFVGERHGVLAELGREFHDPGQFLAHGLFGLPVLLSLSGVGIAWYAYVRNPALPEAIRNRITAIHGLLVNKYYFDDFNERVLARGARLTGNFLWRYGDVAVIDGAMVNGTARLVGWASAVVRQVQSGYLYHYAFAMIIGLSIMLGWILLRG
jgi:NADH-quinone oxidoreductase subunit L